MSTESTDPRWERICLYVDGEMSSAEYIMFEREMAADPALRREVAELMRVKSAVSTLPDIEPPRNFILNPADYQIPAVREQAKAERQRTETRRSGFPSWILAGLVGALMVSFVFVLVNGRLGVNETVENAFPQATSIAEMSVETSEEAVIDMASDSAADAPEIVVELLPTMTMAVREVEVVEEVMEEEMVSEEEAMMDDAEMAEPAIAVAESIEAGESDAEMVEEAPPPLSPTMLPTPLAEQSAQAQPSPAPLGTATSTVIFSTQTPLAVWTTNTPVLPEPTPTAIPTTTLIPSSVPATSEPYPVNESTENTKFLSGFPADGRTICPTDDAENQERIALLHPNTQVQLGFIETCQTLLVLDQISLPQGDFYLLEIPAGASVYSDQNEPNTITEPLVGLIVENWVEEVR